MIKSRFLNSLTWCVVGGGFAAWLVGVAQAAPTAETARFTAQTIDGRVEIGYGLAMGHVDGDQRLDIVLADKSDIVWYQNPGQRGTEWPRHVMAHQLTPRDHVCVAARDLTGDGLVEVAVGANWNPSETSDVTTSGAVFFLERPSDPTQRWRAVPLAPHEPTVHRMHWVATQDPDVPFRLFVLPLHGVGNVDGNGQPARISSYHVPLTQPAAATRELIETPWHMTHNFDLFTDPERPAQEGVWVGGKEGIGRWIEGRMDLVIPNPPSRGVGEVRHFLWDQQLAVAAIEPMHGTDVVVYRRDRASRSWQRAILDTRLAQGHALATGDVLGVGRPQVVAGWRNPNQDGRVGVRLYLPDASTTSWSDVMVDDNRMACEDMRLADLDGDGLPEIVAAGRATNNLVVYWLESKR